MYEYTRTVLLIPSTFVYRVLVVFLDYIVAKKIFPKYNVAHTSAQTPR